MIVVLAYVVGKGTAGDKVTVQYIMTFIGEGAKSNCDSFQTSQDWQT